MPGKKGLGKGLGALFVDAGETASAERGTVDFGHSEPLPGERISTIKLIDIEPNRNQPRQFFDAEALETLAQSIKEYGVMQPILVQKTENDTYRIIAGERRWRASKAAGLKEIPCIIKDYDELARMSVSLIENLQRENLNPIEEAEGYRLLMDTFGLSQESVSERMGKSRSAIANSLRLCGLSDEIKELVKSDKLSAGHARTLLGVPSKANQLEIAKKVIKDGLSVRQLEALIKSLNKPTEKKAAKDNDKASPFELARQDMERRISSKLGADVKITQKKSKMKIEINCAQEPELERIIQILLDLR